MCGLLYNRFNASSVSFRVKKYVGYFVFCVIYAFGDLL